MDTGLKNCYVMKSSKGYFVSKGGNLGEKVIARVICLGKNDSIGNYDEVTEEEGQRLLHLSDAARKIGGVDGLDAAIAAADVIPEVINAVPLSGGEALKRKMYYPEWGGKGAAFGKAVDKGFRLRHRVSADGEYTLYEVIQPHTLSEQWIPGTGTESLYGLVSEHEGTADDPIPYRRKMVLEQGKYYTQNGETYLCVTGSIVGYDVDLNDAGLAALLQKV